MGYSVSQAFERISGFGSVHDVPRLPDGFLEVFDSVLVDTGGLTHHAVIGGKGPPLLLLCGWPQSWFAWRYLMLPLAARFSLVVPDPRGVGLSGKPAQGYDSGTLAEDMFALMTRLGHDRFAMIGHDVGMWTGYAMAADHPERLTRIALGEAFIPGATPSLPLLNDDRQLSERLWHFNFNRAMTINERLVEGREHLYFNYQFVSKAGSEDGVPAYARDFYVEQLRRLPGALKASFNFYRALDDIIGQNKERARRKLTLPVFTFSGALSSADSVEAQVRQLANDVTSVVIAASGHFPLEEQPEALLAALEPFLASYARD